jgi:hypothetical protein
MRIYHGERSVCSSVDGKTLRSFASLRMTGPEDFVTPSEALQISQATADK